MIVCCGAEVRKFVFETLTHICKGFLSCGGCVAPLASQITDEQPVAKDRAPASQAAGSGSDASGDCVDGAAPAEAAPASGPEPSQAARHISHESAMRFLDWIRENMHVGNRYRLMPAYGSSLLSSRDVPVQVITTDMIMMIRS